MNRRIFFTALTAFPAALKLLSQPRPPQKWVVSTTTTNDEWFRPVNSQFDQMFENMWADAANPRPNTVFVSQSIYEHCRKTYGWRVS